MKSFSLAVAIVFTVTSTETVAKEKVGVPGNTNKVNHVTAVGCAASSAKADLDINNVRANILAGGDLWWDLSNPGYEVPKNSGKYSLFAGALWIGGVDAQGQIRVAAQTYRQTGVDFWTGPIDTAHVRIDPVQCSAYDRHWKLLREGVKAFVAGDLTNNAYLQIKDDIESWPGNGDPASKQGHYLAPFADVNGDGIYDPAFGDYPGYNLTGNFPNVPGTPKSICNDFLFGDQTIWWVFNDIGNDHTETSSQPIGLEIRAQAFAFKTNDEINNMTFYKYQVINRSSQTLSEMYFGQFVDPDLGDATDDYVGCDVMRGLGYCYNGDPYDDTASGYGMNPPAIGVDYFQGPVADLNDNVDNDRDGCVDCTIFDSSGVTLVFPDNILPEKISMSKFLYYYGVNGSGIGNPLGFGDFYNYLRGIWLDNIPITYGADGRDQNAPVCDYMFPGTTDPVHFPVLGEWSEETAGNTPEDRRFVQSAGPFTLEPGAVNYITTGVVWARAQQGGPLASVEVMKTADDKAQALFNNCFKLIDGPDAPNLVIRELDNKLIFSIQDYYNDRIELYHRKDPTITSAPHDSLTYFNFQGYQVFQLRDGNVSMEDVGDPDKVRLLRQFDARDGIGQLVNFNYDPILNVNVPVEMVNGADIGIQHTFFVDHDLFAIGSSALVNHKTYYYTVVAYAFNQYEKYNPTIPAALDGQKKPYLAGLNNVKNYSAIPHNQQVENNGQVFGSDYGERPTIKRIEGQGNGGLYLNFADTTGYAELIKNPPYRIDQPDYFPGNAPVDVKVYDPSLIKNYNHELRFDGVASDSKWRMKNLNPQETIYSEYNITYPNEQVIPEWGLTCTSYNTVIEAGKTGAVNNGLLGSSIEYAIPDKKWLNSIVDSDNTSPIVVDYEDWIRSGDGGSSGLDEDEVYENVIGGTWAPFKLTSDIYPGPKPDFVTEGQVALSPTTATKTSIASVDIILTNDRSLWSRTAVVELGTGGTIGNASKFDLRKSPSVGKDGMPGDNSIEDSSMSWFPGYAVNVETGERLNIVFGENSSLADSSTGGNGGDMIWNPTNTRYLPGSNNSVPIFGGMHYIYVFGHNADDPAKDMPMYDACKFFIEKYKTHTSVNNNKRNVWKDCMYVSLPMIADEYKSLSFPNKNFPDVIPSEVRINIRIARKYRTYAPCTQLRNNEPLTPGTTYYVTSLPVSYNGTPANNLGDSFIAQTFPSNFAGLGTVTETPPVNGYNPMYTFGTGDLANSYANTNAAKSAIELINIVPNPYFAFSSYEEGKLDCRVKLTNLPPVCTVSIFTMNGTLVRRFKRNDPKDNSAGELYAEYVPNPETSIDWDLRNYKNIPIASGMYLIHVEAPGLGERTLKWFGMLRPEDPDNF